MIDHVHRINVRQYANEDRENTLNPDETGMRRVTEALSPQHERQTVYTFFGDKVVYDNSRNK
jgi:hypothetical protein